ncbi:PqqD family protein [Micromonospora sp. WMMD882]|uniref:PqqD family protein n=1 Tax=Micromonospora sp. WMMD882 TaxID=3015151 RepID=UPI00248B6DB5|nr:PqqD family protein [Micromonospora sp. WMMD882]WBB82079.1 PqqD family protein [Micromonospora sp. WMMD882]
MTESVVYQVGGPEVAWRQAGDEIVVLDHRTAVYFGLDRSAALLWQRLLAGATLDELVATLTTETRVDRQRATEDVRRFLDELADNSLLRRA